MFDICTKHLREVGEPEQMEQSPPRRSGYVNEKVLSRKTWMVWNFEERRP